MAAQTGYAELANLYWPLPGTSGQLAREPSLRGGPQNLTAPYLQKWKRG